MPQDAERRQSLPYLRGSTRVLRLCRGPDSTADVFAAIVAALWAASVADLLAPALDRALATVLALAVRLAG